ncbi:MAG TPA: AMP-binding protein, partial [Thermoanaerobaculia bacterium]
METGRGDVWALFHSHTFDMSVWELWGALLHGGRAVVIPHWIRLAPDAFYELLIEQKITVLGQTPSAFHQLEQAAAARPPGVLPLRFIIFAGERMDEASVERWIAHYGDRTPLLVNMYGITETTVHSTWRPLTAGDLGTPEASPIGWPLEDLQMYVLDRELRLVPRPAVGELFLGGPGLARGYVRRPDLTAWRFVPDPFASEPGARLYRSGDRARCSFDGQLEYLGRTDHQVKVRGFRIELGEIEAVLQSHPGIRAAVVLAETGDSGLRLLAFLVGDPAGLPGSVELRAWLVGKLPDYMHPAAFIPTPALPLTANGKLDRAALFAQARQHATPAVGGTPRTSTQEVLAGIWADVLGRGRVGTGDNFFHLGGHSLQATQVASRVRDALQLDMPLAALFDHPSPAALAAFLDEERSQRRGLLGPRIERVPRDVEIPLSFAQQRLWFLDRLQPDSALYNLSGAVLLQGPLRPAVLAASLAEIVRRHESLHTRFGERDGNPIPVIEPAFEPALPLVDLGGLPTAGCEELARHLVTALAAIPFALARGPLLRVTLIRLDRDRHVLLVVMHHIVCDA